MKLQSSRTHGYFDYALVALLAASPVVLDLGMVPATICYVVAGLHLTLTLLTDFPLGAARILPFPVHGALELVEAVGLVAAPWIFGFTRPGPERNLFLVLGVGLGVLFLTTTYSEATAPEPYDRYGG